MVEVPVRSDRKKERSFLRGPSVTSKLNRNMVYRAVVCAAHTTHLGRYSRYPAGSSVRHSRLYVVHLTGTTHLINYEHGVYK